MDGETEERITYKRRAEKLKEREKDGKREKKEKKIKIEGWKRQFNFKRETVKLEKKRAS